MKITFIATILNEENSIIDLLDSITKQSLLPDEVILVDGKSIDKTIDRIKYYVASIKGEKRFRIIIKEGNRAVGRNEAIKYAIGDIIVCSDAGCTLDKDWVKNITASFISKQTDVVAGYYAAKPKSIFQKCLVPYVLIMPDKVNSQNFLPASRSIAFKKQYGKKQVGSRRIFLTMKIMFGLKYSKKMVLLLPLPKTQLCIGSQEKI